MKWLSQWVKTDYIELGIAKCSEPADMKNKLLLTSPSSSFQCSGEYFVELNIHGLKLWIRKRLMLLSFQNVTSVTQILVKMGPHVNHCQTEISNANVSLDSMEKHVLKL